MKKFLNILIYSLIGGLVLFLSTLLYYLIVNSLPRVDNPSSTDSIKYVFQFGITILSGLIGLIVGTIGGKIIESFPNKYNKFKKDNIVLSRYYLAFLLIILSLAVGAFNFKNTKSFQDEWNKNNSLGVKMDSGVIEKLLVDNGSLKLKNFDLSLNDKHAMGYIGYTDINNDGKFIWNGKEFVISFDSNSIMIKNDGTAKIQPSFDEPNSNSSSIIAKNEIDSSIVDRSFNSDSISNELNDKTKNNYFIRLSLDKYNYINGISYLTYPENSTSSYLFILARLRATSQQSILSVFSNTGELVYEELLDANDVIETGEADSYGKIIIIGDTTQVKQNSNQNSSTTESGAFDNIGVAVNQTENNEITWVNKIILKDYIYILKK